jgi:tRNA nucleotidyltransferase/poly(A) polymerase
MDETYELLNLRVIRVTTEAAMLSAPQHAESHRRRAAQLLDNADERSSSPRVRKEIDALRRELEPTAGSEQEDPAGS